MKPVEKKAPEATDHTYSYNLDYQFSKKFDHSQLTVGGTYERIHADSKVTGQHSSDNVATFLQYDHKFIDRLNVSVGVRLEYYRVDDFYREAETKIFGAKVPVKPVFRGGLNYELGEYSFIRASFGQGYRYPSVTEKFILKDIGGVGAFPNAELKAEQGYNAELGFKQGYKFGNLKGFVDVAGFYTRYKDMIEFRFGLFNNKTFDYIDGLSKLFNAFSSGDGLGIGAQFTNVGRAEIYGVDLSTSGVYEFNRDTRLAYTLGYVYTHPIFRHMQIIHHELSQGFHQTGRDYQSNAQPDIQYFTDTTPFDIAKNDTPDHTQGKTAQKNRTHLQRNRKKCKTQQSNFGKSKQPYYIIDAVTRFHRRQNTNTDELGKGVADNLRKDIQNFDIESPKNLTFINGCGKWLTVGIGTSINQKNQNAGIESQNVKGRTGKKGTNHSCSSLYGYGLASKLFKCSTISHSSLVNSRSFQPSIIACASAASSSSKTSA